ncbi:uncharacterized protein LOC127863127 [Dreissena polymorpha]|uniref:uncharacterized protein LOC127863127 n=1 Tax=Dreissena polymorpha TaxID=45954 RepID=UPI0022643C7C|nr:uncharacterized protein LOC127863127 [Dreissena polymorpha]
MPPKSPKGKRPPPKKYLKSEKDESEKNKRMEALRIRVKFLEKNMDPSVFQNSMVSVGDENMIGILQGALRSAEEDLIKLRQAEMSSGSGDVLSTTEELMELKEKIDTLQKETSRKLQIKEQTIQDLMLLGHKQEIRVQTLKEIIQAKETRVQVANESSVLRKQLADREYMLQVECGIIQRRVGKTHSAEFATTASSQAETSHVDSNEPETTESIIPNLFRITVDEKMMEIERHNPLILMEKWREAETVLNKELKETTEELNNAEREKK